MTRDTYAFGDNRVHNVPCPAIAAGWAPMDGDESMEISEAFDGQADWDHPDVTMVGTREGHVPEKLARTWWAEAMRSLATVYPIQNEHMRAAYDIADELGWTNWMPSESQLTDIYARRSPRAD
jgi:hypothetical protein